MNRRNDDGSIALPVKPETVSVWLSQAQIAEPFGTKRPAITKHLGIFLKPMN